MSSIDSPSRVINAHWNDLAAEMGKREAQKATFAEMVRSAVTGVDNQQHGAGSALQELMAGKRTDSVPVITEVAKAEMNFRLLMGVRNKVISAYKQTMSMQI
jgi:flagellar hook-basal body complex protein FliE